MLETILFIFSTPNSEKEPSELERARKHIIDLAKFKSNHTAYIIDHYLMKEFTDAGGKRDELYEILLPVYEQAYKDQAKLAEEFKKISKGVYFNRVMNEALGYASEAKRLKLKLNNKAMASSQLHEAGT